MRVDVLLFAIYRELVGEERVPIEVPAGACVADLMVALRSRGGSWSRLPGHVAVAVNRRYASGEQPLADGDEVALIPPVAGG